MSRPIGWVCRETIGVGIINPRAVSRKVIYSRDSSGEITAADFGLLEHEFYIVEEGRSVGKSTSMGCSIVGAYSRIGHE